MDTQPKRSDTVPWDAETEGETRQLADLAEREDGCGERDWTTIALVPETAQGRAAIVSRSQGVVAGLAAVPTLLEQWRVDLSVQTKLVDGDSVEAGGVLAELSGLARCLLSYERPLLNLISRLSGIATFTRRYVDAVRGTSAAIYDTRKTTPGWRRLEKYAVLCGGGHNHRQGLFDGVLIKDNHLALSAGDAANETVAPGLAVERARRFLRQATLPGGQPLPLEVEVDTLDQLADALQAHPDIVLLDNFSLEQIRAAVDLRDSQAEDVTLEASGGVNLDGVREVAETGVELIAVGALTHAAPWLDIGLDWR